MDQQQQASVDGLTANVREAVSAGAQQARETGQVALEASRAVIEAYAQAAGVGRTRVDQAFRTGMAVMKAEMDANLGHFNRLAEARNLQDVIRLQMMWGANHALAIFGELRKIGAAEPPVGAAKTKSS
jgi:hypothetical protein